MGSFVDMLRAETAAMGREYRINAACMVLGISREQAEKDYEAARVRRAEALRICEREGHVWGAVERHGGTCCSCAGDGLNHDCDNYGATAWTDCSECYGLGYTATWWSRTCQRCGEQDQRGRRRATHGEFEDVTVD